MASPRPLDGVRVLAAEQMQALPFATQLLARLGADVVKVEHPVHGDSGRGAQPAMLDPDGRPVGATFLRNNLNKRSVGLDLKQDRGRDLFLRLAPRFDVVCENFKAGTADRLGLGYRDVAAVHPTVVYLSVSGFGNGDSPYRDWPAYASIAEAMSGIYEYRRERGRPPRANPVGALGDISSALFGVIGVLAALRHRDRTGEGQHVDVAMLDAVVAMTDIVTNLYSLGVTSVEDDIGAILQTFKASDGYFVLQVVRPHQYQRLDELVGDEGVESWASSRTMREACAELTAAGLAAGPCLGPADVIADEHLAQRNMIVAMPRTDGVEQPVLIPGNPIKLSKVAEIPDTRVPWLSEHTDEVLRAELGLSDGELAELRAAGVI